MTEYYSIRVVLAISLLWLLRNSLPVSLRNYAVFMASYQAIPQFLDSSEWWRYIWLPLSLGQMVLGWFVCVELFDIQTRMRTFWHERAFSRLCGLCLGVAFAVLAWRWRPENLFQGWTIIHQYYRLSLFVAWAVVSLWFGWVRPLMPRDTDSLAKFWTVWLGCQFVMGSTGRSGIIWVLFSPSVVTYRIVNDCGMVIQILAVLYLILKGRNYARRRSEYSPGAATPTTSTPA